MPHADDASGHTTRRPDEYDEPRIQPSDRDVARLAIVPSVIFPSQVRSLKDLLGPAHIKAALDLRLLPLRGIAGYAHFLTVATFNTAVNRGQ